jgi:hypothetical protein
VPEYTRAGIGIARDTSLDRPQVILVEVLALPSAPAVQGGDPVKAVYRALDRYRGDDHLPALKRSAVLERIARSHAAKALAVNSPSAQVPGSSVHDRVFDALGSVKTATVDVYVADDPASIPRSKSLEDARNDWVGVGAARGDSPSFGKAKYWVVVIYAASH